MQAELTRKSFTPSQEDQELAISDLKILANVFARAWTEKEAACGLRVWTPDLLRSSC